VATAELRSWTPLLLVLATVGCTAPESDPTARNNSTAPAANESGTETNDQPLAENNQVAQGGGTAAFHALGTEPFWGVTVANGRLDYDEAGGERFSIPAPPRVDHAGGWSWTTDRIVIRVDVRPCNDGMSNRVYPTDVRMTMLRDSRLAGTSWLGCGGYSFDDSLAGSVWQIVLIDEDAVNGDAYRLNFTGDQVSGRAGCNQFNGPYRRGEHGGITFGALATTRRACPEAGMTHGRRVLEILGRPSNLRYSDPRTVALGNEEGGMMLRRIR
jgi:heat shock protein HslJ/uncharacterized membrane protein